MRPMHKLHSTVFVAHCCHGWCSFKAAAQGGEYQLFSHNCLQTSDAQGGAGQGGAGQGGAGQSGEGQSDAGHGGVDHGGAGHVTSVMSALSWWS
eukprot:1917176-Lingulodinium_polyedra.AAC.1